MRKMAEICEGLEEGKKEDAEIWGKCPRPQSIAFINPREMNSRSIRALHVLQ